MNKKSLIDPDILLITSGLFYFVLVPIALATENILDRKALSLSLWGYAALILGMSVVWVLPHRERLGVHGKLYRNKRLRYHGMMLSVFLVGATCALILFAGGLEGFFYSASYGERYLLTAGAAPLLLAISYWKLGLLAQFSDCAGRRHWPRWTYLLFMQAAAFLIFWLLWGKRTMILALLLGAVIVYHHFRRPISNRTLIALFLILYGAMVFIGQIRFLFGQESIPGILGYLRHESTVGWLLPQKNEFMGSYLALRYIVERYQDVKDMDLGCTYLVSVAILVPRFLWPERPASPAQTYVMEIDYEYYLSGGGYAYSIVGEAYQNFGFVGSMIIMGVLGFGMANLSRWLKRSGWRARLIYASVAYSIVLLPRMDSAMIIKNLLFFEVLGSFFLLKFLNLPLVQADHLKASNKDG